MARQYKRDYSLEITSETTSLVITGLRISFEIVKDLASVPNLGRIDIYNLSATSRAKIENEFDNVILNVGYAGNVKLLFTGKIKNITHSKIGEDNITVIYAGDGQRDYVNAFSNFTLSDGATIDDLIKRLSADFKDVSSSVVRGVSSTADKLLGYSVSGDTKTALDELGEEYDFDWSIQDNEFTVIGRDAVIDQEFKISAATGMIGSPAVTEEGVDVTFLLNPEVLPGRIITIEALGSDVTIGHIQFGKVSRTSATGRYKVRRIVYSGDTHGSQWYSNVIGGYLK